MLINTCLFELNGGKKSGYIPKPPLFWGNRLENELKSIEDPDSSQINEI
jgi:hypothetical protein